MIKYHSQLLKAIEEIKKPKKGKLVSRSKNLNGLKVKFKKFKFEFQIQFNDDHKLKRRHKIFGNYFKNVRFVSGGSSLILEDFFVGKYSPPGYTSTVRFLSSEGFSEKKEYLFQLVIPLKRELKFHYNIEQKSFKSDLFFISRTSTIANIDNDSYQICCISDDKKNYFLTIDSKLKQTFKSFSDRSFAVLTSLGYITGYFVGNQGFYFCYNSKVMKNPKQFRVWQFRDSINNPYPPVYSNVYGFLSRSRQASKFRKLLRPVSIDEFSILCTKVYNSIDFESVLLLILESSVASLLFRPGGYAIALETISDIIMNEKNEKGKIAPIKDRKVSKSFRGDVYEVLDKYSKFISEDDLTVLGKRIDNLNQVPNTSRLKAPFALYKIQLSEDDNKILKSRDSLLHGKIPDITDAGKNRSEEKKNKDLYYTSVRLYTLLNVLILKWIGYDNFVVNYPKLHESYTKIKLKEEPYRKI